MPPRTEKPGSLGSFWCLRDIPRTGRVMGSASRSVLFLHLNSSEARLDCRGIAAGTVKAGVLVICFLRPRGKPVAAASCFRISIVGLLPSQFQTRTGGNSEVGLTIQYSLGAFLLTSTLFATARPTKAE